MLQMLVPLARNITYNNIDNRGVNPNLAQLEALLLPPPLFTAHLSSPRLSLCPLFNVLQPSPVHRSCIIMYIANTVLKLGSRL